MSLVEVLLLQILVLMSISVGMQLYLHYKPEIREVFKKPEKPAKIVLPRPGQEFEATDYPERRMREKNE